MRFQALQSLALPHCTPALVRASRTPTISRTANSTRSMARHPFARIHPMATTYVVNRSALHASCVPHRINRVWQLHGGIVVSVLALSAFKHRGIHEEKKTTILCLYGECRIAYSNPGTDDVSFGFVVSCLLFLTLLLTQFFRAPFLGATISDVGPTTFDTDFHDHFAVFRRLDVVWGWCPSISFRWSSEYPGCSVGFVGRHRLPSQPCLRSRCIS